MIVYVFRGLSVHQNLLIMILKAIRAFLVHPITSRILQTIQIVYLNLSVQLLKVIYGLIIPVIIVKIVS